MTRFSSMGQRLLLGYLTASITLISFLILTERMPGLNTVERVIAYMLVISITFLGLHLFFNRYILRPIRHLIRVSQELASSNDAQQRARKYYDDELGELVEAFNAMLDQIQLREEIIISERDRVALALDQADEYAQQKEQAYQNLELEVRVRESIESKLTDFQNFLNSILNSMPSALIAIDEQLTITHWNQEATLLTGIARDSVIGQQITEQVPPLTDKAEWISQVWQLDKTRKLRSVSWTVNEQIRYVDIIVYPLRNAQQPSAVVRIDDITDQLRMEEAIVQSEKVMSLGGMAAGMAHEINNPISAIIQNAQNIQRRIDPNLAVNQDKAAAVGVDLVQMNSYLKERKILSFLNNISSSGLRASNLVKNMLQFSRGNQLTLHPCLVVEVLEKAINIAVTDDQLSDFKDNFELNFDQDFQTPDAVVSGVFTELEQVILNLIKNAAYAIKERKLSLNDIDEGVINLFLTTRGDNCIIRVSDNGLGMKAETRKKIFEPFFTTKEVGAGTGLGLSVSYFIITSHHNGKMQVESEPGQGTTFEIQIPLLKEERIGKSTD